MHNLGLTQGIGKINSVHEYIIYTHKRLNTTLKIYLNKLFVEMLDWLTNYTLFKMKSVASGNVFSSAQSR